MIRFEDPKSGYDEIQKAQVIGEIHSFLTHNSFDEVRRFEIRVPPPSGRFFSSPPLFHIHIILSLLKDSYNWITIAPFVKLLRTQNEVIYHFALFALANMTQKGSFYFISHL